jgi:LAO/AO transport system kinase
MLILLLLLSLIMKRNINKIKLSPKIRLTAKEYFNGIKNGNRSILSKSITLIESSSPQHQKIAEELIEMCLPFSGNSIRIGITGVPGVGKSTYIEALGSYLIQEKKKKIAVLAIDPSSKKSSGSILGDKTRMNKLSVNDSAFIRPSPSSGTLGGVAKATRETIILCEAAGFDTILVETVGVGQSEIEVKSMVDFFLLLMLSGAGDELQGIKRGIMEIADGVFINKADGENKVNAKLATQEYKNALHLFPANDNNWIPKVASCSATDSIGIKESWEVVESFVNLTTSNGYFESNRAGQAKFWLEHTIDSSIKAIFYSTESVKNEIGNIEDQVIKGIISPFKAARKLITLFKN